MTNNSSPNAAANKFAVNKISEGFVFEALHTYTDIHGNALYWRIRLKHPSGEKWIGPMYKDEHEIFYLGEPPNLKLKPLYGLHHLAIHPNSLVFIVEGEHPADVLNNFFKSQGIENKYIAITSGSANSSDIADWQPLQAKHCIIWPDNDEPGKNYANTVISKLQSIGCSVEMIDISSCNLPDGGDCVDLLQLTPSITIDELLNLRIPVESNDTQNTNDHLTIKNLALLSSIQYDRIRISTAKEMGVRLATLDNMVKTEKAILQEEMPFSDIEPWHEPINPSELLNDIAQTIKRFIVCQNETVTAATLWAAMTWFIDVIQVAPLAVITAPEKRCGKSQMLFLLSRIVNRPLTASNISSAALFRTIDAWEPTLLIDEADTFMRENEELRGLINCGHTRESAYTIRLVGDDHSPKRFFIWGAKALAGIGKLPETIIDRSIIIELRRKKPEESAERLRHADPSIFITLAKKLSRFAQDFSDHIRNAKPKLPETLNDRAQDNWEPLFAIAQLAGEEWVQLAQTAAIKISTSSEASESLGVQLLFDIQEIYEPQRVNHFTTSELIATLCKDEEKPWATFNRGKPITPRQVASRLKEFGIISGTVRIGAITAKGYQYWQFADAFSRYLCDSSVTTSQPAM